MTDQRQVRRPEYECEWGHLFPAAPPEDRVEADRPFAPGDTAVVGGYGQEVTVLAVRGDDIEVGWTDDKGHPQRAAHPRAALRRTVPGSYC